MLQHSKKHTLAVAMGIRGTDVAKEAASMILTDDNFATIETAVKEGRKLYSNLRKGVRYYLACKVALVSIFLVPIILGIPLPFAPIQIIVLELFMDLAASATFVAEPEETGIMKKPPTDPKEKFLNKPMLKSLFLGALSLFIAVTATFLFAYYTTHKHTSCSNSCVCDLDVWAHLPCVELPLRKRTAHEGRVAFKQGYAAMGVAGGCNFAFWHITARHTDLLADYKFTPARLGY